MLKTLRIALAAAAILSAAPLANPAEAAMLAAPLSAGVNIGSVHKAAVVCGNVGCAPVQTKQIKHKSKLPQHI
jgi:hypothetical protein